MNGGDCGINLSFKGLKKTIPHFSRRRGGGCSSLIIINELTNTIELGKSKHTIILASILTVTHNNGNNKFQFVISFSCVREIPG